MVRCRRGRGAAGEPRPADGPGAVARRAPRRRARGDDLAQSVKIPGFRKGKVPRQVLAPARRPRAADDRGGREPHRRLVLERRGAHARPSGRAAASTTSSCPPPTTRTGSSPRRSRCRRSRSCRTGRSSRSARSSRRCPRSSSSASSTRCARPSPSSSRSRAGRSAPDDTVDRRPRLAERRDAARLRRRARPRRRRRGDRAGPRRHERRRDEGDRVRARRRVDADASPATVKEIKEKVLPPLDDELARAASEFETLAELRADIESRLREQIDEEIEAQFRADVADALVAASKVDAAGPLVEARTRELLRGLARQVEARGVPLETYLAMTGQQPEELLARLARRGARARSRASSCSTRWPTSSASTSPTRRSRRSSASRPSALGDDADETLAAAPRERPLRDAARRPAPPQRARPRRRPRSSGFPRELAEAREAIWTPDKEKQPTETKLWTPGSEGAT